MSRYRVMTYLLLLKQNEHSSDVQLCIGSFTPHSVESFAPCDILKIYSFNKYLLINQLSVRVSPPMNQLFAPSSMFFFHVAVRSPLSECPLSLPGHSMSPGFSSSPTTTVTLLPGVGLLSPKAIFIPSHFS